MTEKALQNAVVELAHRFGWVCAHFGRGQGKKGVWFTPVAADAKGYPDLTLVRERVVFAELKANGNKLRPEQEQWLSRLRQAQQEVYLWTPKEWQNGDIEEALRQ